MHFFIPTARSDAPWAQLPSAWIDPSTIIFLAAGGSVLEFVLFASIVPRDWSVGTVVS